MARPAESLGGMLLDDGWQVVRQLHQSIGGTGGNNSTGYIVRSKDGTEAFLKAVDFHSAATQRDPMTAMQSLAESYNFERSLLHTCRLRRLDRVVQPIADGSIVPSGGGVMDIVHYIIFELAEGDIRAFTKYTDHFETAWALRCLHHVATGLQQLHNLGIAHQDLKPSNVLVYNGDSSKLTDLGRASSKSQTAPHDGLVIAGDRGYAPPEQLYGYEHSDWSARRFGCDAYHLGSMIVFFFTGLSMTTLLVSELHPDHRPHNWHGTYADVLPYIRDAFGKSIDVFYPLLPEDLQDKLIEAVRQLCDPDPDLRGHPRTRSSRGNPFDLQRYVSLFDQLARLYEYRVNSGVGL